MPIVKAKSLENITAANLLVKHGMFAASVHCSYYSGFQLSKYVLSQYCAITYKKQEDESRGMDSHFFVSNKVSDDLSKKNRFYSIDYNSYFGTLKMLRKKADYSNKIIKDKDAEKAIEVAKKLTELLTEKYNII